METHETVTVHNLGVARSSASEEPRLYSAMCRRCGAIIEQSKVPVTIGLPGLYAVRVDGNENLAVWEVSRLQSRYMEMCVQKETIQHTTIG
jgi:hypothetical protein